jgi:hypothetical protein
LKRFQIKISDDTSSSPKTSSNRDHSDQLSSSQKETLPPPLLEREEPLSLKLKRKTISIHK